MNIPPTDFYELAIKGVMFLLRCNREIAVELVSNVIWVVFSSIAALIFYFKRRSGLPLKVYFFAVLFRFTQKIQKKSISVDGFYYALYDSSKSKLKGKSTRVSECIYLRTHIFSNRVTGYVFRRVKRKNGKIEQNNYYSSPAIISMLRIVGSFSQDLHIFFGFWLDPYKPDKVAGTLRLKWFDNNTGKPTQNSNTYLLGHWNGVSDKLRITFDDSLQNYYGYADTGGVWHFQRISIGISGFRTWRKDLEKKGDGPDNPKFFLNWSKK